MLEDNNRRGTKIAYTIDYQPLGNRDRAPQEDAA